MADRPTRDRKLTKFFDQDAANTKSFKSKPKAPGKGRRGRGRGPPNIKIEEEGQQLKRIILRVKDRSDDKEVEQQKSDVKSTDATPRQNAKSFVKAPVNRRKQDLENRRPANHRASDEEAVQEQGPGHEFAGYPDGDLTIEQWYADPYERLRPDQMAYDEQRRRNLQDRFLQKGYSQKNTNEVIAYLMHCNGKFQPHHSPRKRGRRKMKVVTTGPSTDPATLENAHMLTPESLDDINDDSELHANTQFDGLFGALEDDEERMADEDDEDEEGADSSTEVSAPSSMAKARGGSQKRHMLATTGSGRIRHGTVQDSVKLEAESKPAEPSWGEMSDGMKLEKLHLRLTAFKKVYGENGPTFEPDKYRIEYVSHQTMLPQSVPVGGFMTQGHSKLVEAKLAKDDVALSNHLINPAVIRELEKKLKKPNSKIQGTKLEHNQTTVHRQRHPVENVTFGITTYPAREAGTAEEVKVFNDARLAKAKRTADDELLDQDIDYMSDGSDKERFRKKSINEAQRKEVLEQLERSSYPSQTEFMELGFSQGLPVWKTLKERTDTLNAGGEAADRLREEMADEQRKEFIKQKRCVERADAQVRKRERADQEQPQHVRKRAKLNPKP